MYNPYFLPQQQVLQANGKSSIDAIKLSPNSSVLVMDTTAPLVWLCTSDSLGNVTSTPYEIKAYIDPKETARQGIEDRLSALEVNVNKILEGMDHEPNDGGTRTEQNVRNYESDTAD